MSLRSAIDNLKFDARMTDINIKSQNLTAEELKKRLESLPDVQAAAISLDLEAESNDSDDDIMS